MRPASEAVVSAGLIPDAVLEQFTRWGVKVSVEPEELSTVKDVVARIGEALEHPEQVDVGETNLDVLREFFDASKRIYGKLFLWDEGKRAVAEVAFVFAGAGLHVALPWAAENVETPRNALTNGESYLRYVDGEMRKVDLYFDNVTPLVYGARDLFLLCHIASKEAEGEDA